MTATMIEGIHYEKISGVLGFGCTYRLLRDMEVATEFRPHANVTGDLGLCGIDTDGRMWARKGYTWDGASGIAWDTKSTVRAALFHDVPYQLLRERDLSQSSREPADRLLYKLMREDGAWPWRAKVWLWFLRHFAGFAAKPRAV